MGSEKGVKGQMFFVLKGVREELEEG